MKAVNASTIAKLVEAHMDGDKEKFLSYASFIADAFEEAGDARGARIIRARLDGSYKSQSIVTLDQSEEM